MIYFIGGAPRVGKTILCRAISTRLKIGWISTDLLFDLLRVKNVPGIKSEWNASSEAIAANAEWFYPCLERFVWGVSSMAESYIIEGVDFLPEQVAKLSSQYPSLIEPLAQRERGRGEGSFCVVHIVRAAIHSVFLGCSQMTLDRFDQFPGHSPGYSFLPELTRQQFAQDIPPWSEFVRQEAQRFGLPYLDMSDDFPMRLREAEAILTGD